ncbi:MAG: hypothetical protein V1816_19075 [Pseudomonadota bacterium]
MNGIVKRARMITAGWLCGLLACMFLVLPAPGLGAEETVTTKELHEQVSEVHGGRMDQQDLLDKIAGRTAELEGVVQEVRDDGSNIIVLTGAEAERHFTSCLLGLVDRQDASGIVAGQTISFTGKIEGFFLGSVLIKDVKLRKPSPTTRGAAPPPPPSPSPPLPTPETGVAAGRSPEEVINLFYSACTAREADLALDQWAPEKRTNSLRRMIDNIEWFRIDRLQQIKALPNSCLYNMTATGKSRGEKTITWNLDVRLVLDGGEWKILSWSNIRKIGG